MRFEARHDGDEELVSFLFSFEGPVSHNLAKRLAHFEDVSGEDKYVLSLSFAVNFDFWKQLLLFFHNFVQKPLIMRNALLDPLNSACFIKLYLFYRFFQNPKVPFHSIHFSQ